MSLCATLSSQVFSLPHVLPFGVPLFPSLWPYTWPPLVPSLPVADMPIDAAPPLLAVVPQVGKAAGAARCAVLCGACGMLFSRCKGLITLGS